MAASVLKTIISVLLVISRWPLNETHGLPVTWGDEEYTQMTGGTGCNVEVYDDKVVFRARNYAAECWLPGYNYKFKIK